MKNQLFFLPFLLCVIFTFISCVSVVNAESYWHEIIEADQEIWNRRIGDEDIIISTRENYARIKFNHAKIEQIYQNAMTKLTNKDCIASAVAIDSLNKQLESFPNSGDFLRGSIEQLTKKSKQKGCRSNY